MHSICDWQAGRQASEWVISLVRSRQLYIGQSTPILCTVWNLQRLVIVFPSSEFDRHNSISIQASFVTAKRIESFTYATICALNYNFIYIQVLEAIS